MVEAFWQEARFVSERKRNSWQWWELSCPTDYLGYGNNASQQVQVRIA